MRIPRIYHPEPIINHQTIMLFPSAANHVGKVLRMKIGDKIELFDGTNHFFSAIIRQIDKKNVLVYIESGKEKNLESPLNLHLGQVISRGDKMEFTIQKSVELGVNAITPLFSERCGVLLQGGRLNKKIEQWQKIAIAACEQCGRNKIPPIHSAISLEQWIYEAGDSVKINLNPRAQQAINQLTPTNSIHLLIGSEGGLSPKEILSVQHAGFLDISLGPRVLRTETASLTAISILQSHFGDLK